MLKIIGIVFLAVVLIFNTFNLYGMDEENTMIKLHYHRPEGDYAGWNMWSWSEPGSKNSIELKPKKNDAFGLIFEIDLKKYPGCEKIGLLPKRGDWEEKDGSNRLFIPSKAKNVFIISENPRVFTKKPDISPFLTSAFIDGKKTISVNLSKSIKKELIGEKFFSIKNGRKKVKIKNIRGISNYMGKIKSLIITLNENLPSDPQKLKKINISATGYKAVTPRLRGILDTRDFTWNGPLGVVCSPEKTIFYVYAPDVDKLELLLFDTPEGKPSETRKMTYLKNGVYSLEINRKLSGKYYKYRVYRNDNILEILDPYSKCNKGYRGYSYIVDPSVYTPVTETEELKLKDAVIYELHVRDFTISKKSGVKNKGLYPGFCEKNTSLIDDNKIKTGLAHLKELGVNVIQIMPVQSFAHEEESDDYNWGYMPAHYFAVEGWYSSDRSGHQRIIEFKKLVDTLHKEGFKVVIDVVYNHTAEGTGTPISFMGLAPWYYYRTNVQGYFENGSGCGNEFRTEAPMARRLIIDSMRYFVEFFGVDGFRYDLMGLIDYDTLIDVERELREIKPDILIYGEPWGGGSSSFQCHGKGVQYDKGFSVFNDTFRDALKGSVWNMDPGYIQNGSNREKVLTGIYGSITDFACRPYESVNYIDCHDNHTFYDRLLLTNNNDKNFIIDQTKLGAAILLTSQGVPFLHSGQEILRSKGGCHNSYDKPDSVNKYPWANKKKYSDVFKYYKGLIKMRKEHPMFRFEEAWEVRENLRFLDIHLGIPLPGNTIAYQLLKGNTDDEWNEAIIAFNPGTYEVSIQLPGKGYKIALDKKKYYPKGRLLKRKKISDFIYIPARSALVLYK